LKELGPLIQAGVAITRCRSWVKIGKSQIEDNHPASPSKADVALRLQLAGPPEKKQILQPISLNLNLDGRTLAQAMSDVFEDLYTHPRQAPSPNGWTTFPTSDANIHT
jgi:hypothetical protein